MSTPAADSSIHPVLAGTYSGTIVGLSFSVRISRLLSGVQQSQGNISDYIILGPTILGCGPLNVSIDIAKHLRFTVTDSSGYALLFFSRVAEHINRLIFVNRTLYGRVSFELLRKCVSLAV